MDLGGPKLRTGPLLAGPAVIRLKPRRDAFGRVIAPARLGLHAQGSPALVEGVDCSLPVDAAWLGRLAVTLQRQPGWQQRVREMLARRTETLSPRYQQVYDHNLEVIFEAVADVLNSRTPKQDRRLRAELASLQEDLQTLIAQGEAAPAEAG